MPARLAPTGTGSAAQTLAAGNDPRFVNGAMQTLSVSTSFMYGSDTRATDIALNINAAAGINKTLVFQTAGLNRFSFGITGFAENGNQAGSTMVLSRWNDDGSFGADILTIYRDTGYIQFGAIGTTTLYTNTAPAGDNSTLAANTAFVLNAVDGMTMLSTTGGTTTLTQAQYSAAVLVVTGALTSNAVLVVPASGIVTVINRTTGAFTLTVKTTAGTGATVLQGYARGLIADGTNVVVAQTDFSGGRVEGSPIGLSTPSSGAFTTLSATGTVSGAGFVALHAAPGPIGNTTASTGAFTALSASGGVSGAGFVALHASPGPIGNTTPSSGAFTTLSLGTSTAAGTGTVNGPTASARITTFSTAGSKRWDVGVNSGTEAGSNLGSDFYWARYNDSGVVIDNPLTINRGSGVVAATNLATTGYSYRSGATGLTAAGTTQATGYAIATSIVVFTTVAANSGARLPNVPPQALSSSVMAEFTVVNAGANALLLYPASGLAINALAANAALSVAAGATTRGFQNSTTTYRFA